jgi:hypothetical protein
MEKTNSGFHHCYRINWVVLGLLVAGLGGFSRPVYAGGVAFAVPSGGATSGDCTSINPCTIQYAVEMVDAGGTVYAAGGTYTGSGEDVVAITRSINLLGGWDGTTVTPNPLRDPVTYESIINGENSRRPVKITGAITVWLDGFSIQGGNAESLNVPYCIDAGCGGGIYVHTAEVKITNNIIQYNVAADTSEVGIYGTGGGIYVVLSNNFEITHNIIQNNNANPSGYGRGGGVYITGGSGSDVFASNQIISNDAGSPSSVNLGDGMLVETSDVLMEHNLFSGNNQTASSGLGSGLYVWNCQPDIRYNRFVDNVYKSAVYLGRYGGTFNGNIVVNPSAMYGIYVALGGSATATLTNNIVANHNTDNVRLRGAETIPLSVNARHNTLAGGPNGIYVSDYVTLSADYNIISDTVTAAINKGVGVVSSAINCTDNLFWNNAVGGYEVGNCTNSISGNPLYVNLSTGDLHIQIGSAAINRLADTGILTDVDGQSRPVGSGGNLLDVGADEFLLEVFMPLIVK